MGRLCWLLSNVSRLGILEVYETHLDSTDLSRHSRRTTQNVQIAQVLDNLYQPISLFLRHLLFSPFISLQSKQHIFEADGLAL